MSLLRNGTKKSYLLFLNTQGDREYRLSKKLAGNMRLGIKYCYMLSRVTTWDDMKVLHYATTALIVNPKGSMSYSL